MADNLKGVPCYFILFSFQEILMVSPLLTSLTENTNAALLQSNICSFQSHILGEAIKVDRTQPVLHIKELNIRESPPSLESIFCYRKF